MPFGDGSQSMVPRSVFFLALNPQQSTLNPELDPALLNLRRDLTVDIL